MSSNIRLQRICQRCGVEFTAKTTKTKYCSHNCGSKAGKDKLRDAKIEESNKELLVIKSRPIEELKAKSFLSIAETSILLGISRRTIYRMIEQGELLVGKARNRTIIRRIDIDNLFQIAKPVVSPAETVVEPVEYEISECYSTEEVRNNYGISESGLRLLIIDNAIPKYRKGRYAYIPKVIIDKLLS